MVKKPRRSAESYLGEQVPGTSLVIRKILERGSDRKLRVRVDCLNCGRRGLHRRWENIASGHTTSCNCRQKHNHRTYILNATASVENEIKVHLWDNRRWSNAAQAKYLRKHLGHVASRVRPGVVRECIREINAKVQAVMNDDPATFFSACDYEIESSQAAKSSRQSRAGFDFRGEWTRKAYRADRAPLPLRWAREVKVGIPFIWDCKCDLARRLARTCDELFRIEKMTKKGRAGRLRRYREDSKAQWMAAKSAGSPFDPGGPQADS